jgi:1-acyl-sn-glycerol-3-phosphate acyltransferase
MFVLGITVETEGAPCDPSEAKTVVCAPHSTLFDSLYLVYAYRVPCAISKAENLKIPLLGKPDV